MEQLPSGDPMTRRTLAWAAVVLLGAPLPAGAQSAADSAAIRATALDYAEGWYTGDSVRMARAVHPDLAKRIVNNGGPAPRLNHMTAASLIGAAGRGGGKNTPADRQRKDVRILDVFQNTASVRADMSDWIDYMQMAKWNDRWVIVNVLWEMRK
jgi:hypothetical protein